MGIIMPALMHAVVKMYSNGDLHTEDNAHKQNHEKDK